MRGNRSRIEAHKLPLLALLLAAVTWHAFASAQDNVALTMVAAGEGAAYAAKAIDTLADGSRVLNTHWFNVSGVQADAWVTVDLGAARETVEIAVATRDDRSIGLDLHIGNSLSDGQVTGAPDAQCTTPGNQPDVPTSLYNCSIPAVTGRCVTVMPPVDTSGRTVSCMNHRTSRRASSTSSLKAKSMAMSVVLRKRRISLHAARGYCDVR